MLVREHLKKEKLNTGVKIFATDIDEAAVAQARSGCYTGDIVMDVGEERLNNFFTWSRGHWQTVKDLREMILFANHSIIKDPPFSRLDLLVCRNFLIYLNPDMQKRLISLFHLALKPGGFLFLGASETVGQNSELFTPVNKKWKIYQRRESCRREDIFLPFTAPVRKPGRGITPRLPAGLESPAPGAAAERILLERYSPPCVVVNERYEVLHISSRTRPYLEVPVGEPTTDILKMAGETLRPALRAAIYKSFAEKKPVLFQGVRLTNEERETNINVLVEPLIAHPSYGNLALVILEVPSATDSSPDITRNPSDKEALPEDEFSRETLIRQLEEQLRITHEQLRFTTEQLEASNDGFMAANEDLMSINEEFQSANEELQSTNEELEASKEELQALNEELATVNAELQGNIEELNQSNSDMENHFASSGVATIFLDRNLTIKRFSPAMAAVLNLIPADIGRPFRHLSGTIDWSDFQRDTLEVMEKLVPIEREVASLEDGRHFIMRILPYRSLQGDIDGIVVTLVDITELRRAEDEIRSAALFPQENPSPVLRIRRDGTILFANRSAERLLSQWRTTFGRDIPDHFCRCIEDALADGITREHEIESDGRDISFNVVPLPERNYVNLYGRDITKRKQAEEAAYRVKEDWERTFDSVPDMISIIDNQHRVVRVNKATAKRLGLKPEDCIGLPCYEAVHGTSGPPRFCPHTRTIEDGSEHILELHEERLGGDFVVTTTPLLDKNGKSIGSVHIARDITERKRMEDALRKAHDELEIKVYERTAELREKDQLLLHQSRQAAMGEMIGNIAHQWRQPLNTLSLIIQMLPIMHEKGELDTENLASLEEKATGIIQHMSQTIEDFSNYFRPDKERIAFRAGDAVAKTLTLIEDSFRSREIKIEVNTEHDPVINGFPNEFSQVLLNILINARDAFAERKISAPEVIINMTTENSRAVVTISDNAGGIPEEIINKIFDPYFTTKGPQHGSGVGLFMSKGIIEKNMGGRISVRNTANGAEFRIEV